MMRVKGGRVNSVAAKKLKQTDFSGLNVNVNFKDVHFRSDEVQIVYEYTISYAPDMAEMIVVGEVWLDGSKEERKNLEEEWKKTKQLSQDVAEEVLTALSYTASAVGTLLAYALGINAPINVQRVRLQTSPPQKAS